MQLLWKTAWRFLKKLKTEWLYDPAIPLLGIYLEKMKTLLQKDIHTLAVPSSIIYNSQETETTEVPVNNWLDKQDAIYTIYNIYYYTYIYTIEYYLSHKKKNENVAIYSKTDGLGGYHAKWNKSNRERHILNDIIYMWNLKNTTK